MNAFKDLLDSQLLSSVIGGFIGGLLALAGVVLANYLNNRNIRKAKDKRIIELKKIIGEELKSILAQIIDKKDIINQAIAHLSLEKNYLPLRSVSIIAIGYQQNISELHNYLTQKERNCLHVIYERLFIADEELNNFENNFKNDYRDKIISKPFKAYRNRLNNLNSSYDVVSKLINNYLMGKPEDVFHTEIRNG